jgi:hypothetical protein
MKSLKTANQRAAFWIVLYIAAKRRIRKETHVNVTNVYFFSVVLVFTGLAN